jgi:hypothetical protein
MEALGRTLVFVGLGIAALGGLLWFSQRIPWMRIGRLPGDISIQRDGFGFYLPLGTCLALSVVGTLILWLVATLRR